MRCQVKYILGVSYKKQDTLQGEVAAIIKQLSLGKFKWQVRLPACTPCACLQVRCMVLCQDSLTPCLPDHLTCHQEFVMGMAMLAFLFSLKAIQKK